MKLIKIIIFLLITFNTSLKANLNNDLQNLLNEGEKLIFIRHAHAPGSGDPKDFNIIKCSTQRNLGERGKLQALKIRKFFENDINLISEVISSEWCRCKETAEIAFKKYKTKYFLNSFFDDRYAKNKSKQIIDLKRYVNKAKKKSNLVLITHYVVISELVNYSPLSGEIVVTDKNYNLVKSFKISY